MIGALVASFPRKPRLHLKAQKRENLFPNHMSLVNRCQKVCAGARGPGYLESDTLNVYDAATSYFLALMGIYTFRWRLGRLYFGECLTILRTLGLHKPKGQSFTQLGTLPTAVGSHQRSLDSNGTDQHVDNITLEMGRRIFWTMFVSVKSMEQLGANFGELVIPPPTHTEPYPPLPAEVDDFCIYPTHTEPQPAGLVPIISGFNANVRVYCSYNALATMEMAWGIDAIVDWDRQKRVLHESLSRCKDAMTDLPQELTVPTNTFDTPNHQANQGGFYPAFAQPHLGRDPAASLMSPSSRPSTEQSAEERRSSQYEIQKANIYASSLATRSYLVEKYWNLCEAHQRSKSQNPSSMPSSPGAGVTAAGIDGMVPQVPTSHYDMVESEFREERENIVKDLLVVLGSIDQVNMEPNADSFVSLCNLGSKTITDSIADDEDSVNRQYTARSARSAQGPTGDASAGILERLPQDSDEAGTGQPGQQRRRSARGRGCRASDLGRLEGVSDEICATRRLAWFVVSSCFGGACLRRMRMRLFDARYPGAQREFCMRTMAMVQRRNARETTMLFWL